MSTFQLNTRDSFYSLSAISNGIKEAVTGKFGERPYWIVAEISELNVRKGHCYLSLVEKLPGSASPRCEIKGIIWASKFQQIADRFHKATGMVLAAGTVILFSGVIRYDVKWGLSLILEDIEPKYTVGLLQLEREKTVALLKSAGEYDLNRELELAMVPYRVAVISAKDSKGFEDFTSQLQDNNAGYRTSITLFSSMLQGEKAAADMVNQLLKIYEQKEQFDIVAIVRGGGGSIDLNCFNDYKLARAVARFPLPVITGIGHTTNISVVDEVAYQDCITPTAAADFIISTIADFESSIAAIFQAIVENYNDIAAAQHHELSEKSALLKALVMQRLTTAASQLNSARNSAARSGNYLIRSNASALKQILVRAVRSSEVLLRQESLYMRQQPEAIKKAAMHLIASSSIQLTGFDNSVRHLDPSSVLKRGYSITRKNGKAVHAASQIKNGDILTTQLYEGTFESQVIKKSE